MTHPAVEARVETASLDLPVLDALARLHLQLRRRGGRLWLLTDDPHAAELLSLVGLGLEPRGHAEAGEQGRVQEVVHVRDATP